MTAINTSALSSSLTGSKFDWQTFVDQIIKIDSAPITKLQTEQSNNNEKSSALDYLKTNLAELQTATTALNASGLFTGRTATSATSGSNWSLTAESGAAIGSYAFNVTQLATVSKRTGTNNIGAAIAASDITKDTVGSGTTIATLATSSPITAGTITINGTQITIAATDSLEAVFKNIYTATGGAVTAAYDHSTDTVSLNSSSEIVLGSVTDSSNFLSALQLFNNGTGSLSSSNSLGAVNTKVTLANSRLTKAITAVDVAGKGTFALNGVNIDYNVNTDSLTDVIKRINSSAAGVTASYDTTSDRMVLINNTTGDTGFGLSEAAGGFLAATGLSMSSAGAVTSRGKNAQFSINGGATISSATNTFGASVTGLTGLTVQATSEGTQTITVASNTAAMKTAIQNFIDKYNMVQTYIDTQTQVSVTNGTVSTSVLSNNREVQDWAKSMRSKAFSAVSGLSGTISRLADLGIDFSSTSSQLVVRDSTKLDNALTNKPSDVAAFFNTSSTGFTAIWGSYLKTLINSDGTGTNGKLESMQKLLTTQNANVDTQIAQIQRQLDSEKERMIAGFQAMEAAQTKAKSMITLLQNAFSNSSNNSNN